MKNILLAVTGLTPQVITETIYAIHQNRQKVDEIHVITTLIGKEKIYSQLLGSDQGQFYKYLKDYGYDKNDIFFDCSNLHVVTDEHGNEIEDIVNSYDNERLLLKCLELTFQFTAHENNAVLFSIAGGRKTMSSCLTLAAQLYGRSQDRIYHVLVSPEYENNSNFFYPPLQSKQIMLFDAKRQPYYKETKYAQINLVSIPFVSIRRYLASDQLKYPKDPATLMLSIIKEKEPILTVDINSRKLAYKTIEMDMMPSQMALYAFFALKKKQCPTARQNCTKCRECFLDIAQILENPKEIADLYKNLCGTRPLEEMSDSGITGLTVENYRSLRSKINKAILTAFGPWAVKEFEISASGVRPDTKYGILLDRNRIKVVI